MGGKQAHRATHWPESYGPAALAGNQRSMPSYDDPLVMEGLWLVPYEIDPEWNLHLNFEYRRKQFQSFEHLFSCICTFLACLAFRCLAKQ